MKILLQIPFAVVYSFISLVTFLIGLIVPLKSQKNLKGQLVLITGAGRGLGREISYQLAEEGVKLICIDIDEKGVRDTVSTLNAKYPNTAEYYVVNVADKKQVASLAEKIAADGKFIDILINNAGIVASSPLLEATDDAIERMLNVNLMAHFWSLRAFLPEMLQRNSGHIVAVSSAAAFTAAANIAIYSASKYGVTGLMACLREELRQKPGCQIKTTTVHPFFLDSQPINVEHWKVNSRLSHLGIPEVARAAIEGIKNEDHCVTVPHYMYLVMHLLRLFPISAVDYWRDIFYAKIDPA